MSDCVNVFDSVNVFDCVNVSVDWRHSLIVVPLDALNDPNVVLLYELKVMTVVAGISLKALEETSGSVSP